MVNAARGIDASRLRRDNLAACPLGNDTSDLHMFGRDTPYGTPEPCLRRTSVAGQIDSLVTDLGLDRRQ
jgi:hypothetical protein